MITRERVDTVQSDCEQFSNYMLAEFNMSFAYSCQLDTRLMKAAQYCLTMMAVVLSGSITIVTTVGGVDPRPIVGPALLFAGLIGGWFICFKHRMTALAKIEQFWRGGIQGYFGKFDRVAFREFGGELLVSQHTLPMLDTRRLIPTLPEVGPCLIQGAGVGVLAHLLLGYPQMRSAELSAIWLPALAGCGWAMVAALYISKKRRGSHRLVYDFHSKLDSSRGA